MAFGTREVCIDCGFQDPRRDRGLTIRGLYFLCDAPLCQPCAQVRFENIADRMKPDSAPGDVIPPENLMRRKAREGAGV